MVCVCVCIVCVRMMYVCIGMDLKLHVSGKYLSNLIKFQSFRLFSQNPGMLGWTPQVIIAESNAKSHVQERNS